MADEKDRFGETMKLVERAKEDIYFAERNRELIAKLKAQLQKVDKQTSRPHCPREACAHDFLTGIRKGD